MLGVAEFFITARACDGRRYLPHEHGFEALVGRGDLRLYWRGDGRDSQESER